MDWRAGTRVMLTAVLGLATSEALAQSSVPEWSASFGNASQQWVEDVAVDATGGTLLVGQYAGAGFDLGGGNLKSTGYYHHLYLAKLDSAGAHVWSREIPSVNDDDFGFVTYERRFATDPTGGVVLAGNYFGAPNLGCGPLAQGSGVFVMKLDSAGGCVWSRGFPGAHVDTPRVDVDATGQVAVAGFFNGTLDFGGGPRISVGHSVFITRLSASGQHVSSRSFEPTQGGAFTPNALGITFDGKGGLVVTGGFSGALRLYSTALLSRGGDDIFVIGFDSTNGLSWTRRFGDSANQAAHGIDADSAGNLYLTGGFGGTLVVDSTGPVSAHTASDAFLLKLGNRGAGRWMRAFHGTQGVQYGTQVRVGSNGDIATTGRYTGNLDLGPVQLATSEVAERYVAKVSSTGNVLWGTAFVNEGYGFDTCVAVNAEGGVHVAGSYEGDLMLRGVPYTSQGEHDVFAMTASP